MMNAQAFPLPALKAAAGNQSGRSRFGLSVLLGVGLTLSISAFAGDGRTPMSDDEVLGMGEEPGSGIFLKLSDKPPLQYQDNDVEKGGSSRYTTLVGSKFRPRSSAPDFFVPSGASLSCRPTSSNSLAEAQLHLPDGAKLQALRIYGADATEQDLNVRVIERCQPVAGAGTVVTTQLANVGSSGSPGKFTEGVLVAGSPAVDNLQCSYALRLQLSSVVGGCGIGSMQLDKARVQWIE